MKKAILFLLAIVILASCSKSLSPDETAMKERVKYNKTAQRVPGHSR